MRRGALPALMRVEALEVFQLQIPFVQAFAHARQTRAASDAVIVRVTDADGVQGYGEGLPRDYVSGEDVASMVRHVEDYLAPRVFAVELPEGADLLAYLDAAFPDWTRAGEGGRVRPHAACCAVELALLDLVLRREGRSLGH